MANIIKYRNNIEIKGALFNKSYQLIVEGQTIGLLEFDQIMSNKALYKTDKETLEVISVGINERTIRVNHSGNEVLEMKYSRIKREGEIINRQAHRYILKVTGKINNYTATIIRETESKEILYLEDKGFTNNIKIISRTNEIEEAEYEAIMIAIALNAILERNINYSG